MDTQNPFFSIIIPVYNRPEELNELLESCLQQSFKNFELIILEDGSTIRSESIIESYENNLTINYIQKTNTGPSDTRNKGMQIAKGEFYLIIDSDVILPKDYLSEIYHKINQESIDCFGGPDAALSSFTPIQKAINFSMTSFITTGGIRGSKSNKKFFPRSFNMGLKPNVFKKTNGFNSNLRFGEDIDLSIRIYELGFNVKYLDSAYVFHKRRTSFKQFFKQIFNSGIARINLSILHKGTLKPIHFLPFTYLIFFSASILIGLFSGKVLFIYPLAFVNLLILLNALIKLGLRGFVLGLISANIQLLSYGLGFLSGFYFSLFQPKKLGGNGKNLYQ